KALESYLHGTDGKETLVTDITGKVVERYVSTEPDPGDNCFLTIDLELQEVAEQALAETIEGIRAKGAASRTGAGADAEGGAVVVIDVDTGEVLAMASYPTYNLATFNADYNALTDVPLTPMVNRATSGLYPPGSTFKMVTSVAALEEDIITPNTQIRDLGRYTYWDDYQPRCWIYKDSGRTHGLINVSEALKYSCNYFYYEVGRVMGIDKLVEWASRLGLGKKTGIELGDRAGQIASPETIVDWEGGLVLQAAIGQSAHQFTPLQLANYVATIVNGGTRYQPHLLRKVMDYSLTETVEEIEPTVLDQIDLAPETIEAVKKGMRGVVTEDGTASSVFLNYPIEVGGKTGSAQTRSGRSAHGVFVSFAPYDKPEIAVCVVGEHAGSGGSVAPVCVAIYNEYFGLNEITDPGDLAEGGAVHN
ncbi:MAG: penicillin-binding protein A, partial [Clostridia bacterium]|nr:penicillin-binding protein A [Clostridia bacterium]